MNFSGTLLALDVGGGTQDLLLWQPGQPVENSVKMVLPAPTQILSRRLLRLAGEGRAVFLCGRVMGGGAVSRAVRHHLQRGLSVYATPQAALTFSDRLEDAQQEGVVLTDTAPSEAVSVSLGDIDLEALGRLLAACEIPLPTHFAVAVQDHGFHPRGSNRRFRFQHWENFLRQGGMLKDLAFASPPPYLTRMKAVQEALPGALVMDTCAAGAWGALLDSQARKHRREGLMVVNLGNAHTFAALVQGDRLRGIYEHHTGLLTKEKLHSHLTRFQAGQLTNDEVFADGGHGCAHAPDYPPGRPFSASVLTGPRRRLARDWPGILAAPGGDMMLTGCFGLVAAFMGMRKLDNKWLDLE